MPATLQAALLGIVQGLTEFLPVSSSAHLILARAFFGFDGDKFGLPFDVACHVGTLIAVVIYFRRELGEMVASVPRLLDPAALGSAPTASAQFVPAGAPDSRGTADFGDSARLIWLLVAGTIPAIVVGGLFNRRIEEHLRTPGIAAFMLAAGALFFLAAERLGSHTRDGRSLTMADAFWIGCAQAVALIPGVSRSGVTIALALLLGFRRTPAARFVFLLSIPAILAAAGSEGLKLVKNGAGDTSATLFLVGVVASAIVGYLTVKYFIRYLADHTLDAFAWYRLALAVTVAVWLWRA